VEDNIFGKRLKELRIQNNLTQQKLAASISVRHHSSIGAWEAGINMPGSDILLKIADYFDVSTDYLLGRKEDY